MPTQVSKPEVIEVEATPVYYHECPALGPNARVIEATLMNKEATVVLGYQYKCPFCSYTATDFKAAPGVTPLGEGKYSVDMSQAIKAT